jgi:hypothetical protein
VRAATGGVNGRKTRPPATVQSCALQACVAAFRSTFVNDSWLVRPLPQMVNTGGFDLVCMQSHGYVEAPTGAYMLTWIACASAKGLRAAHTIAIGVGGTGQFARWRSWSRRQRSRLTVPSRQGNSD